MDPSPVSLSNGRRTLVFAFGAAVAVMLATGIGYRLLADYLAGPTASIPLAPGTLARLPLKMNDWQGQDVPLDQETIRVSETDDRINRAYVRTNGTDTVGMYIGYGVRARDLMPHRPEVCYIGAGWTLQEHQETELPLPGGGKLPCQLYRFTRGMMESQGVVVLNYYIVDGQYCSDVSLLRSKAWRGSGSVRYVTEVLITSSSNPLTPPEAATDTARRFAAASASLVRGLMPDVQAQPPRVAEAPSPASQATSGGRP